MKTRITLVAATLAVLMTALLAAPNTHHQVLTIATPATETTAPAVEIPAPVEAVAEPAAAAVTEQGQPQGRQDNDTVAHPVAVSAPDPAPAPAPAPGPWVPALTGGEQGVPVTMNGAVVPGQWLCWSEYGMPLNQAWSQTCPANWGNRPPENPTPFGAPARLA